MQQHRPLAFDLSNKSNKSYQPDYNRVDLAKQGNFGPAPYSLRSRASKGGMPAVGGDFAPLKM
jgi:hypothetical protein